MPFSGKVGAVSRFFQEFRQGGNVRVEASAVAGAPAVVVQQPYVHLVGFASRHDGSAGRRAAGSRVAPGSQHALPGQGVQGRSRYFRPVAAKVGPTHVIRQDEDDVGLVRQGGGNSEQAEGHAAQDGKTRNETHEERWCAVMWMGPLPVLAAELKKQVFPLVLRVPAVPGESPRRLNAPSAV